MSETIETESAPSDSAMFAELASSSASGSYTAEYVRPGLRSESFWQLLTVQFFTVFNDNVFRWLAVPLAKPLLRGSEVAGTTALASDAKALALGLAGFTLPFLFFAAPAGYLADRFSKSKVITACKSAEILIMALGFVAILSRNIPFLFFVIGLTGAMNALFAPSRQGSIPELVHEGELSRANGLMGLVNIVPCALGFLAGNFLAGLAQPTSDSVVTVWSLAPAIITVMGVAIAGWYSSLRIQRIRPADPQRKVPWNIFGETTTGVKLLISDLPLIRASLGIAFFWALASLAQMNIDIFGIYDLGLKQSQVGILGFVLVLGVGAGSVLAGVWSGGRVELGLVPAGAVGIAACSFVLYAAGVIGDRNQIVAFEVAAVALCLLGLFAGLFDVPLEAYLQHRSDPRKLGTILAATNFLVFAGNLVVAAMFYVMIAYLNLQPGTVFLVAGLATIPIAAYVIWLLPGATIRFLFWVFTHTLYRPRIAGLENIPTTGGALLVSNHVTWVDGILLMAAIPRPVRFIAYADYVHHPRLAWLAKVFEVIPVRADSGPKAIVQSLRTAREAIEQGHVVGIFAEGTLTRTGQMQPFQGGFLRIVQGTGAPVIPVYLDGLWGSIFSYRGGKFFWKWPHKWFQQVGIYFGTPIPDVKGVDEVRASVQQLGVVAVQARKATGETLCESFVSECRRSGRRVKVADSSGKELSGSQLLAGVIAFWRVLNRRVFTSDQKVVGILLPPSLGGVLANTATTFAGKVTANINYTLTDNEANQCLKLGGIKKVLTSRLFLEKRPMNLDAEMVFLEDIKAEVGSVDKLVAGVLAYATPLFLLKRLLGVWRFKADDLLTLIFTSGSTGEPKGVMLTHHNLQATVESVDHIVHLRETDTMLGVLPFFHSLGFSVTLWLPLCLPPRAVYHVNPLDSRVIGELSEKWGVSILLATPTFLRSYLKRITKEQFHKLDLVVVGAEKLPVDLAKQFEEKFGVLPSEGYGATETTGPAAVNVPDHRSEMVVQIGTRLGSVGRPLPGVAVRIVHPDTGENLGSEQEGIIWLNGGNVMAGYWQQPDKTAAVLVDGWYNTGDMGKVDSEGFIHITGRLSRFSKIAGEMVPHLKLEEYLLRLADDPQQESGDLLLAVTAVPDAQRGERIVVVHRELCKPAAQIVKELGQTDLPNLWLPSADSFLQVEKLPVLGTGKLDLKGLKQLALAHYSQA